MDTNISVNTGHSLPDSIPVQEPGCGARVKELVPF
jgi:hypothetical protein